MDRKVQFLKIFANLPLGSRDEIIVVIDNQPLTWNAAKLEIENATQKGEEILEMLVKMKILE